MSNNTLQRTEQIGSYQSSQSTKDTASTPVTPLLPSLINDIDNELIEMSYIVSRITSACEKLSPIENEVEGKGQEISASMPNSYTGKLSEQVRNMRLLRDRMYIIDKYLRIVIGE